jgi:hypothetical protein
VVASDSFKKSMDEVSLLPVEGCFIHNFNILDEDGSIVHEDGQEHFRMFACIFGENGTKKQVTGEESS